jgi:hypothetical protein
MARWCRRERARRNSHWESRHPGRDTRKLDHSPDMHCSQSQCRYCRGTDTVGHFGQDWVRRNRRLRHRSLHRVTRRPRRGRAPMPDQLTRRRWRYLCHPLTLRSRSARHREQPEQNLQRRPVPTHLQSPWSPPFELYLCATFSTAPAQAKSTLRARQTGRLLTDGSTLRPTRAVVGWAMSESLSDWLGGTP